ncbi:hypothetical protein F4777DRAFT_577763 [Nemania sp. FL0916]|nr:hypothetical protein F4777DRAFT_577763 [Nemania sp. FL0916]
MAALSSPGTIHDVAAHGQTSPRSPSVPANVEESDDSSASSAAVSRRSPLSTKHYLPEPFSNKIRRAHVKEFEKLMKRRNKIDQKILRAAGNKLRRRELRRLKKSTEELAKLEGLYRCDPSSGRAQDYDLVRKLLWRFKRNLGPRLDEYISGSGSDNEDSSRNDQTSHSRSDSRPTMEQSDTSDGEDNELSASITAPKSPEPSFPDQQKRLQQADTCLEDTTATEISAGRATPDVQAVGVQDQDEETTENCSSDRDQSTTDEDMGSAPSGRQLETVTTGKDDKKEKASTPETQTIDI